MTRRADGVVVVGAGLAGLGAVRALRAAGHDGPVVLVGAEAHAPYDRPPLSKDFLAGRTPVGGLSLAAPEDVDLGVEVRLGERAVALHPADRTVELASGERVGGRGVVIATGARARTLAPGGVHTLRTLDDAQALRAALQPGVRLVVVGGGFIGVEVASTARGLGIDVDVTVVEIAAAPLLAALGPELGRWCAARHAEHGVHLLTGASVAGVGADGAGRVRGVRLGDGRELPADVVLVGVGTVPDVEWLRGSGLDVQGGVLTDAEGATAAPGVVATGDCTRRYEPTAGAVVRQEHWTNALQHPQRAVAALLGRPAPPQQATARVPYVWSDQFGARLQFAGHHLPGDVLEIVEGSLDGGPFAGVYRRGGTTCAVVAADHPRFFTRLRRELAAAQPA